MRRTRWAVLCLLGVGLTACTGSFSNSATTGTDGGRYYRAEPAIVFKAAQQAFSRWPRGRGVLDSDPKLGTVHGYSETNFWKFKDDLYVTIRAKGARSRVEVTSKSRIGQYDFGGNNRNIEEYLSALDRLLGE